MDSTPFHRETGAAATTTSWAAGASPVGGLLDALCGMPVGEERRAVSGIDDFLSERDLAKALGFWLSGIELKPGPDSKRQIAGLLVRDLARIDVLLSRQLNAVLHHPRFQRFEASWRGLAYLVHQTEDGQRIKIRLLNLSWKELNRDVERAIEFDQSQLFRKVYSEEFGTPGGEPFGLLLGDYEIRNRMSADSPTDDIAALTAISRVAAAAFAPFITAAHASMFGVDNFSELEFPGDLARTFQQLEQLKWRALRDTEDARFLGMVVPRVLLRLPYSDDGTRADGFCFHEDVTAPDRSGYLWGNAAYAFAAVVLRAFSESGWLASIRGVERGVVSGGLVTGLPIHSFGVESAGVVPKSSTDAAITDLQEKEISELGFIPLCHCFGSQFSAFYTAQSVQNAKSYDRLPASVNAKLSTMLQYILCVSRFAHYLKAIARDKIGSFRSVEECEEYLQGWLNRYTVANDQVDLETKARYPLREATVSVREQPGKPGSYQCVAHLRPHFQLDQMTTAVRLATEIAPARVV